MAAASSSQFTPVSVTNYDKPYVVIVSAEEYEGVTDRKSEKRSSSLRVRVNKPRR